MWSANMHSKRLPVVLGTAVLTLCLAGIAAGQVNPIDIEKATNGEDADTIPGPSIPVGDPVTWTYTVTNNYPIPPDPFDPRKPLRNVVVTDNQGVTITCDWPDPNFPVLSEQQSVICTADGFAEPGQYANIGTVEACDDGDSFPGDCRGSIVEDNDPSHYFGLSNEIGDFVWHDTNGNGIQDNGEPGLNDIVVMLLQPAIGGDCGSGGESLIDSTTTGDNPDTPDTEMGFYLFSNLDPQQPSYCVKIKKPQDFECTLDNQGQDNALDSDFVDQGDGTCLTVDPDQNPISKPDLTWDAGLRRAEGGGEGCTPGYWKQPHHFGSWTGFAPDDAFSAVFGVPYHKTLLEALQTGGGKEKALGRHAVAALLNATSTGVSSDFTSAQVIALVQGAWASGNFEDAKNQLAAANEQHCGLGRNPGENGASSGQGKGKKNKKNKN